MGNGAYIVGYCVLTFLFCGIATDNQKKGNKYWGFYVASIVFCLIACLGAATNEKFGAPEITNLILNVLFGIVLLANSTKYPKAGTNNQPKQAKQPQGQNIPNRQPNQYQGQSNPNQSGQPNKPRKFKYCPYCAAELIQDTPFCPFCAASLK